VTEPQPGSPANNHGAWDAAKARYLAESLTHLDGACLPILHALQEEFGYIHADAVPIVADVLNLSRAEVVGVVNFYSDFRQEPPARHHIQLCVAEACQAMGSRALAAQLTERFGVAVGEAAPGGPVELAPVYCLGNCALSPALVIDGRLHGRVTSERAARLLAAL
jgi:formate dehydrogenase subunit gamma